MDTVAGAAHQDYPVDCFQVFLLDDAADPKLEHAVKVFNRRTAKRPGSHEVVYLARKKPAGERHYYKSGNLRFGLEVTDSTYGSSEYFGALDADMIPESDWLARCTPHMINHPGYALVGPPQLAYNIPEGDPLSQDSNVFAQILEPIRNEFGCSQCSGSGYIMRRSALASIGGWPLATIGADILCSYLLQEQGWKTASITDEVQFGMSPGSFHAYIGQRIRWVRTSCVRTSCMMQIVDLLLFRPMAVCS